MRAIVMHQRGGPDVLTYETDFPDPSIGPSDVLIRVRACGMNRLDIFTREGQQGVRAPLPHILGMEVAGDVVAVGEAVPASGQATASCRRQASLAAPVSGVCAARPTFAPTSRCWAERAMAATPSW